MLLCDDDDDVRDLLGEFLGSIGYTVQPWVRLEGFYDGSRQTIDRPGGELNRNRFGFQVITSKPMRIR